MKRRLAVWITGAALSVALAPVSAAVAVGNTGNLSQKDQGQVEHYGYQPGVGAWHSPVLDASRPANRDANNFKPAAVKAAESAVRAAPSQVALSGPGFSCSMYVGGVGMHWGSNTLSAYTSQFCSGAFLEQKITGHFDHSSWLGWSGYSAWSSTHWTSDTSLSLTWPRGCNDGNDKGGTYDYRFNAYGTAQSSYDGSYHSGGQVHSESTYRQACGSGIT